jgi:carnitine 3-dehydrogenase
MSEVQHCAVIGGGVIGAGWAARMLLNGLDVTVRDPAPDIVRSVEAVVANAERALGRLWPGTDRPRGSLRFANSVSDAVRDADFVQESAPERETLKRTLLREIDAHAPTNALICSSTSGLLPTRLQAEMRRPERMLVGHPFNPVYLLPLVEVCAGAATAQASVERASAFYRGLGMKPLHVRKEIDGFIADRLLEALWREALWLVHDGVATTAEIDDAIRFGAGLRWSFMGTFLIYRLAGGEAGMRHFLAQFGPALQLPWTKLMDVPDLTDAFIDEIARQSDLQAEGVDLRTLERKRDDCLVAVLQALRGEKFGAGALLAEPERAEAVAAWPDDTSKPLRLHGGRVEADWVDYNNHMTEARYLHICTCATDAFLALIGAGADYVATGHSFYTAETHLVHLREIAVQEPYYATTQVLAADEKRVHLFHRIHRRAGDAMIATGEHMLLHVDMRANRACPAPPEMAERARILRDAHAALPRPPQAGRSVGARRTAGLPSPPLHRMIDSEVAAFIVRTESFYPSSTNRATPADNRAHYNRMCDDFRQPYPAEVSVSDGVLRARHPDRQIRTRTFVPPRPSDVTLLYLHGGGYVLGGLDSHDDVCAELCQQAGIEVLLLDYRLAPEHVYPAALDDTEAAFRHLRAQGKRVIVGGDSAGGNLAAALCLRMKRLRQAMPLGQVLIYPGLGGDLFRNGERNLDAPLLPVRDSGGYRGIYAGGEHRIPKDDPEFAPLCAPDLRGLPHAAIFAAGIDPLRQDAEDFSALLAAAGVPVMFRSEVGLVHGYLRARHMSRAAARSFAAVAAAVSEMVSGVFPENYATPPPGVEFKH